MGRVGWLGLLNLVKGYGEREREREREREKNEGKKKVTVLQTVWE